MTTKSNVGFFVLKVIGVVVTLGVRELVHGAVFPHESELFLFDWRHQSHGQNAVSHDLNAIFDRVT